MLKLTYMSKGNKDTSYKVVDVIRSIFVYTLSIALVVGAILFAINKSPNKSIFGFRYYTIITPSMDPTYKVGDLVFIKLTDENDINVGDVITFNPSSESTVYLTHRVTQKFDNYEGSGVTCYKTKGDANNDEDAFLLDQSRVIGKAIFSIPKLGYAIRFIQLKWYFVIPLAILFLVFLKLLDMYVDSGEEDQEDNNKDKPAVETTT